MHLVVVTDSAETRHRLRPILRALGHSFVVVKTLREAEAAMAVAMPGGILFDLQWPRKDGWVLGRWITSRVPDDVRVILSEDTPLIRGIHVWPILRRATFLPYVWDVEDVADATGWSDREPVHGEVA